jgi:hypothetical protein
MSLQFLGQRQDFCDDLLVVHPRRERTDASGLNTQFVGGLHRERLPLDQSTGGPALRLTLLPGFVLSRQLAPSLG